MLGIDASGAVEIVQTDLARLRCARGGLSRSARAGRKSVVLYRDAEPTLELQEVHRQWGFDADPELTRLTAEALRISMAYHFDPHLAIHSSDIDPLPHQITAVYEAMLPRQPLRFLLADDPGAGKTIMTGLLMKELYLRGDLERCLIVCPGSLAEQWQDELSQKFDLPFEIFTADQAEASRTGNWFGARSGDLPAGSAEPQRRRTRSNWRETQWDLVVVRRSTQDVGQLFYGDELDKTKRYRAWASCWGSRHGISCC